MTAHSQKPYENRRPDPPGWLVTDPLEDQAKFYIAYHQDLWERQPAQSWVLGLYMAKQWLRYLQEPHPDL